jgi:hypothetical protein
LIVYRELCLIVAGNQSIATFIKVFIISCAYWKKPTALCSLCRGISLASSTLLYRAGLLLADGQDVRVRREGYVAGEKRYKFRRSLTYMASRGVRHDVRDHLCELPIAKPAANQRNIPSCLLPLLLAHGNPPPPSTTTNVEREL